MNFEDYVSGLAHKCKNDESLLSEILYSYIFFTLSNTNRAGIPYRDYDRLSREVYGAPPDGGYYISSGATNFQLAKAEYEISERWKKENS